MGVVVSPLLPQFDLHPDIAFVWRWVNRLYLRAENMSALDLSIYNRYGQEVARLKRGHESWDARTFSGETVPDGTYFYVFEANGLDGVKYKLNGVITVLR